MKRILSMIVAMVLLCGIFAFAETAEPETTEQPKSQWITEDAVSDEKLDAEEETVQGRLAGKIIGVDPGHQGKANSEKERVSPATKEKKAKVAAGTRGYSTKIPEYQTVLDISLKLRDALVAEGATVVMSRETNDVNISNLERAKLMNDANCDLVLRIHCNGNSNHKVNGTALYVRKSCAYSKKELPNQNEVLENERNAAQLIIKAMCKETGAKNLGVIKRDAYTMNNWSKVPIILVETGFQTNKKEDENLNDPAYQDLLVKGMIEGMVQYFGTDAE